MSTKRLSTLGAIASEIASGGQLTGREWGSDAWDWSVCGVYSGVYPLAGPEVISKDTWVVNQFNMKHPLGGKSVRIREATRRDWGEGMNSFVPKEIEISTYPAEREGGRMEGRKERIRDGVSFNEAVFAN